MILYDALSEDCIDSDGNESVTYGERADEELNVDQEHSQDLRALEEDFNIRLGQEDDQEKMEAIVAPINFGLDEERDRSGEKEQDLRVKISHEKSYDAAGGVFYNDRFEQEAQRLATSTLLTGYYACV
jgi:hypothetical protein